VSKKITIIGGGPGGYVAAIRGAQLGADVTLIENHKIGGTCLNYGCIPTKAFFKSAEVLENLSIADRFGLDVTDYKLNVKKLQKHKNDVVEELTTGIEKILLANGVNIIKGTASFVSDEKVSVVIEDGEVIEIESDHFILATGSKVYVPNVDGIQSRGVVTSKDLLEFDKLPERLVVLGGGVVAMEFASIFNAFGSQVTVVARSSILKGFDKDVVKRVSAYLKKKGIRILTDTNLIKITDDKTHTSVHIEGKKGASCIEADMVLSAMGRKPNVDGLFLDKAHIELNGSAVITDDHFKTTNDKVYAIGDVTGPPWLAHKASHEGIICVEKLAGEPDVHAIGEGAVPGCTYCRPQVASVGMTEAAAKDAGYDIRVGRFPMLANGKAIALGDDQGLIKTIFDKKTGELLGAHMVGPEVTELIQGYAVARTLEATEVELMQTIFPHPTLSEAMHESVLDAYGRAIHF